VASGEIQIVSNEQGETAAGESGRETAYLLKSDTMRRRLVEAKQRHGGLSIEEVVEKLGIRPFGVRGSRIVGRT
jgi:hypothetical protein